MNIEARIEKIMDEQVISDRFRKREFVVQTKSSIHKPCVLNLLRIKLQCLTLTKRGRVNVEFNIRGREWTAPRWCNTLLYHAASMENVAIAARSCGA